MRAKLELACKAAYEASAERHKSMSEYPKWEDLPETWKKSYFENVEVLLRNLKDPPEEFHEAAHSSGLDKAWHYRDSGPGSPGDFWNFMIDWLLSREESAE